ncbi:hypothetical protein AHF37_08644, partial [Paragonimus kellicotti]
MSRLALPSTITHLRLEPDGPIILGPRTTNETVSAGHDATFKCEVSPEEHRSSTIRWGKSIDAHQRAAYEAQGREVIHWAGGTFVVLPIITNTVLAELEKQSSSSDSPSATTIQSDLQPEVKRIQHGRSLTVQLPASGAVATEASANQLSRLLLIHAALADSGRYVCSVLTEDGRDDHKFVHVTVIGSSNGDAEELVNGGMRRLTVYIAVPMVVFFICLCVVTYCLISRRASRTNRAGHRRHRTYYSGAQQSQIKSPSAASSSSIGVCRNGVTPGGTSWHTVADPRLRPSPIGTGPGTTTLGYSSTNGSNSLPGNGQMLITTQGYPTSVPGSVTMVPGSYPILLQSMNTQQGTPMYAVQDPNAIGGYQPNIYPNSTAGGNEYMLTGNALSVFPAGVMYPVSNGHTSGNNNSQMMPNSNLNSSSPESSAITGPGSPLANETVEGRLVFQTGQPGQQPVFQTAYPNMGTNFGYQSHMSSNTGDFDLAQSNTPLLPFPTHGDGAHHGGLEPDGPIILGPRTTNETVSAGHDATFKCEVSPEEHRSSTIRWGKSIDAHQRAAYEAQGREVIHWAGGTFVVLPIITNTVLAELEKQSSSSDSPSATTIQSDLQPEVKRIQHGRSLTVQLPASGAVATEASANQLSRLLLIHAALADSGRYVCSVLTEDGRDDHKFVHVTVI